MTSRGLKKTLSFFKLSEVLIFPSFCRICSAFLDKTGERVVCRSCLDKIRPHRSSFCFSCGAFFEIHTEPHLCAACMQNKPTFSRHRSCGLYQGTLKDVIILMKYRKYSSLVKGLSEFILRSRGNDEDLWWGVEALIPVPLHPGRKKERSFNQAELLAKELSRHKNIPVLNRVIKKARKGPPQTSLTAVDRARNAKGSYEVDRAEQVEGKIVLLIDDVYTTGATLKECGRVLMKAGAGEVRALTIAQA